MYVGSCFPFSMSCLRCILFNQITIITAHNIYHRKLIFFYYYFFFPHMAEQKVSVTDPFISKNAVAVACTKLGSFIRSSFHLSSVSLSKETDLKVTEVNEKAHIDFSGLGSLPKCQWIKVGFARCLENLEKSWERWKYVAKSFSAAQSREFNSHFYQRSSNSVSSVNPV